MTSSSALEACEHCEVIDGTPHALACPARLVCPAPAAGPRTKSHLLGSVLKFAPGDDACTWCDHCGYDLAEHGARPAPKKSTTWHRGVRTDAERGPGIRTHRGWFYPFTPSADEVDIRDVAHALAMVCRFGGHVRAFYSVAQHSVLVSRDVPQRLALVALLHDAPEAYIGDMIAPIKRRLPCYALLEDCVWWAVVERFDLREHGVNERMAMPPEVKRADLRALVTEQRDLWAGPPPAFAVREVDPWPRRIWALGWRASRYLFLRRWQELTGERVLRWHEHWPLAWLVVVRVLNALRGAP